MFSTNEYEEWRKKRIVMVEEGTQESFAEPDKEDLHSRVGFKGPPG